MAGLRAAQSLFDTPPRFFIGEKVSCGGLLFSRGRNNRARFASLGYEDFIPPAHSTKDVTRTSFEFFGAYGFHGRCLLEV